MSSNIKVLQVIPKLGYGGAETGCFDIAHYLPENNCKSFIVTSGGELLKFVDKKKVKVFRLPVNSKNPLLILINAIILIGIILINLSDTNFEINTGDRIAQMVIAKHEQVLWTVTDKLDDSERGNKGYGSTGI